MSQKTFYAAHPDRMAGATIPSCDRHVVSGLFRPGEIVLTYSHGERYIIGGAVPLASSLVLPRVTEPASLAGQSLLARRELSAINIGAVGGAVILDGERFDLAPRETLYVPMGSGDVIFEGQGARFYLLSVPAHRAFPLRKLGLGDAKVMERGSLETSKARTIHQLILPHTCESASLCLGLTILKLGSAWNTMPPHVHERRSEVYLYFDLGKDDRIFHYMFAPKRSGTSSWRMRKR